MDALQSLDMPQLIALAAVLGWASGLRLYAVLLIVGLAGRLGWVDLPSGLQLLQHPAVLVASGAMMAIEFLADKIPGLDTVWDLVHTLLRIPAGAALAAAVFGTDQGALALVAAVAGGTLAATSHAAKATTRAAVNTSPEPFSNWALSLLGDAAVPSMLWLAFVHPWLALGLVMLSFIGMLVLIWWMSSVLCALWRRLRGRGGVPAGA